MAQFFTDFAEYPSGVGVPADWVLPWNNSPAIWEIAGTPQYLYNNYGEQFAPVSWSDVADVADVEVLALTESSISSIGRLYVRLAGTGTAPTGYYLWTQGTALRINKFTGTTSATQIATTAFTSAANTKYWMRLRISGGLLYGRIWADGSSEPGTWQLNGISDSSISAAGKVAIGPYAFASLKTKWYAYGVGTGGDVAPSSAPAGTPTLNSLTASNITSSGARFTVGLTR